MMLQAPEVVPHFRAIIDGYPVKARSAFIIAQGSLLGEVMRAIIEYEFQYYLV